MSMAMFVLMRMLLNDGLLDVDWIWLQHMFDNMHWVGLWHVHFDWIRAIDWHWTINWYGHRSVIWHRTINWDRYRAIDWHGTVNRYGHWSINVHGNSNWNLAAEKYK